MVFAYLQLKCVLTVLTEGQRRQRWYNQIHNLGETTREVCITLQVRNLTYMCLFSPDHTHGVSESETAGSRRLRECSEQLQFAWKCDVSSAL